MAGYHEWLAGDLLITILINSAGIVNLMRIIFIWRATEFVRQPGICIAFGLPTPFSRADSVRVVTARAFYRARYKISALGFADVNRHLMTLVEAHLQKLPLKVNV